MNCRTRRIEGALVFHHIKHASIIRLSTDQLVFGSRHLFPRQTCRDCTKLRGTKTINGFTTMCKNVPSLVLTKPTIVVCQYYHYSNAYRIVYKST